MKKIDDETFNQQVIYSKHNLPFLLYFHSNNCKYCVVIENILNNLEKEYKDKFLFFSILIDENEKLRENYFIRSTPTTYIFDKENTLVKKIYGSNLNIIEINKLFDSLIEKEKKSINFFKKIFKKD